jgi:hypothetical protein
MLLLMLSCNLPTGAPPANNEALSATTLPGSETVDTADVVGTSVELTTIARLTELAPLPTDTAAQTETPTLTPTFTPTATPCVPLATANVDANIRSGPGTMYDISSFLASGKSTTVMGRNDANTWWYILLPGSTTNYGWIAASVVTTSCLPSSVQVVAAPPTPIPPSPTSTLPPPVAGVPDLVAAGMQYWPSPAHNNQPVSIQVKVTNKGTAPAGSFSVSWLSNQSQPGCSWNVNGLGVGASKNLDCQFTYQGNPTATYWITLVVDTSNQVAESDEGNNSRDGKLKVSP